MEKNVPFTDDDLFSLNMIGSKDDPKINAVILRLRRNVSVGAPIDLTLGGAEGDGLIGDDKMRAHGDAKNGPNLAVLYPTFGKGEPSAIGLTKARVTVVALPKQDGEPLAAHLELSFDDGQILDATYMGKLESEAGPCGGDG